LVEETLLKKRRTLDDLQHRRAITVERQVKRKRVVRGENVRIKRPEQFVREFRIKEGSKQKMERRKRQAAARSNVNVPKSALKKTVGLVVRIHAGRHTDSGIKKELAAMGLVKKYDAKFLKLDEEAIAGLKALDAYVAYGYVSLKSVKELLHNRAYYKNKNVRMPLTDNLTVERVLGQHNILCLDDMVHEVFHVKEHFAEVTQLLCSFQLAAPIGNFEKKMLEYHEAIESIGGFMGDGMEEFLCKVL